MKIDSSQIQKVSRQFAKDHDICPTGLVLQESSAIYWTRRAQQEIEEGWRTHNQRLINDGEPTWGLIRAMLARVSEHTEAAICAYLTGSPASAEVIARTVVEGSLHIGYIVQKDRCRRMAQYFSHYFDKEEREITQWLALADKQANDGQHDAAIINRNAAVHKQHALGLQEACIVQSFPELGLDPIRQHGWPRKIIEQFQALGLENDYRTVYAAMCSQTHNDAEDLINLYIVKSVGDKNLIERMGLETVGFSRLLLYFWGAFSLDGSIEHCPLVWLS